MPPVVTREGAVLVLSFAEREHLGAFFEDAEAQSGFLLELDHEPRLFTEQTLRARLEGGGELSFQAQVIQCFPARDGLHSAALQLVGWEAQKAALRRLLAAPAAGETNEGEVMGVSPVFRIQEMTVAEKALLAHRANRGERRILVRDSAPPVLLGLLHNPWIEEEEVLTVVQSHYAAGGIFQRVMSDRRWRGSYAIRLAVAKNPKTPQPLALSLIPTLRPGDLRRLARSQDLREPVRREALRAVQRLR